MPCAPHGAEGKPSSQNRAVFRLNQSRAVPSRAPEGWVPPLSPVGADPRLCLGPGERRGGLLGGQGRRHASRGCCAAVSFQMKKKKKKEVIFSGGTAEASPEMKRSGEYTWAARLQGHGWSHPAAAYRPPVPPSHRYPPAQRRETLRRGQTAASRSHGLLRACHLRKKLPPPEPRSQGAGWLRAQRSALISPRLRSPGAGARALTSPSTINLPSTALLPHLAFNVKTYIFVGSGLSRALVI